MRSTASAVPGRRRDRQRRRHRRATGRPRARTRATTSAFRPTKKPADDHTGHEHLAAPDDGHGRRGLGQPGRPAAPPAARRHPPTGLAGTDLTRQPRSRGDEMGQHEEQIRELVLKMYDEVWNKGNFAAAERAVSPGVRPTTRRHGSSTSAAPARPPWSRPRRTSATPSPTSTTRPSSSSSRATRVAYLQGAISGTQTRRDVRLPALQGRRMRVWKASTSPRSRCATA